MLIGDGEGIDNWCVAALREFAASAASVAPGRSGELSAGRTRPEAEPKHAGQRQLAGWAGLEGALGGAGLRRSGLSSRMTTRRPA